MSAPAPTRRVELTLERPRLALYAGIRPTVVIGGRGQPAQWGRGTWQLPADTAVPVSVYLFARLWRFGEAEIVLGPGDAPGLVYRAPRVPFGHGSLRTSRQEHS